MRCAGQTALEDKPPADCSFRFFGARLGRGMGGFMKSTRARSIVVYILAAAFLAGLIFFVVRLFLSGQDWATSSINDHLSHAGQLSAAGKVLDRDGEILAQTVDGQRVYHEDETVRRALMQTVGDSTTYISTAVQTAFRSDLVGYNPITGISLSQLFQTGNDMTLTVDADVSAAALQALGNRNGAVAVYNYETGEILCMVSTPTYDPANRPDVENDTTGQYEGVYLNKALSGTFTPGSTFKVITSAAAIENLPDLYSRTFTCNGSVVINGEQITCHSVHGQLTFQDALAQSCNVAFAELAVELGKDKLTETAQRLGCNQSFSIDGLPTAASSYDVSDATENSLAWSGVGQYTDLVNPMHMMILMGAIARGGTPVNPYLISQVSTPLGFGGRTGQTTLGETMLEESTATQLRDVMRYAVQTSYGDGMFPNLTVCAKTGTGEVGEGKQPNGWMVGFTLDADCPLAFAVVVENGGSGISSARPVASSVLQAAAAAVRGQ